MSSDPVFELDIRRTIILGACMGHWGMPSERMRFTRGTEVVEAYLFPAAADAPVARILTVGASAYEREGATRAEYMLALTPDLGGASFAQAAGFLMDLALYARQPEVRPREGMTVPPSPLVPAAWPTRAMMLDEPRAEPEALAVHHVGSQHVNLWWVIPIHEAEYRLIREQGIKAFDALEQASGLSLADVRRPSFVSDVPTT
jgi:hypothetical protein